MRPPGPGYGEDASSGLRAGERGGGPNLSLASTPSLFQNHSPRWTCSCGLPGADPARGAWSEEQSLSHSLAPCSGHCPHTDTPQLSGPAPAPRPHSAGASLLPAPTQFPARSTKAGEARLRATLGSRPGPPQPPPTGTLDSPLRWTASLPAFPGPRLLSDRRASSPFSRKNKQNATRDRKVLNRGSPHQGP